MVSSFLHLQRYYIMKYFYKCFDEYYKEDEISKYTYEECMNWCNDKKTLKSTTTFCSLFHFPEDKTEEYVKMVNLLAFSNIHPYLFENNRIEELKEISSKMATVRKQFFYYCKYCSDTSLFTPFLVSKELVKECILQWTTLVEEWREMDKCLLVQDCIVQYVELMNLQEQLEENMEKSDNEKEKKLNIITKGRIKEEKMKCKKRIYSIDGKRGIYVMNEILKQIDRWEKNEKKLKEQIKTQMNKAFWDSIKDDIEKEKFVSCQLHIKELVKECGEIFNHNEELLDDLVEQIDFDFMKQRCETKTTDSRYWYSIFISILGFLKECDALQNERLYISKIEELYLWTEQMNFEQFKDIFFWIKARIYDIVERKKEFEKSSAYQNLKKERDV